MLDFPNSPTTGQVFPSPQIAGTAQWSYDGAKWVPNGMAPPPPPGPGAMYTTGGQTITGGWVLTPFSIGTASGTVTPNPMNGNYQYLTNNAAFTLAAPTSDCAMDIMVTNGASAGAITFSGFTVGASPGDPLTTTNNSKFIITVVRINGVATYAVKALQ